MVSRDVVTLFRRLCFLLLLFPAACRKEVTRPGPPPKVEAYVWQAPDRPEVIEAMSLGREVTDALHVRAAEFRWDGKAFKIERRVTQTLPSPGCGLVLRIGASASALDWTPARIAPVAEVVRELAALSPREIQCDYDCPQKRLDQYVTLLDALQTAAGTVPVVPTALPSWLGEPVFKKLITGRAGYVLQVHSLRLPSKAGDPVVVFDPVAARAAALKASALGVPFRIAMATYGCEVWFDGDGKVIEVISEDAAPEGKRPTSRAFSLADPNTSASLIAEWNAAPPPGLQAVIWYRLPVQGDRRNWPWTTFRRVSRGESAESHVVLEGTDHDGARDLHVVNRGEFPVLLPREIVVKNTVIAADGTGAYQLDQRGGELHFIRRDGIWPWLDPGKKISCGWLRTGEPGQRINWHFAP